MNKNELVAAVASKAGITKVAAAAAVDAAIDSIIETVARKEDVTLVGFGTFKAVERAARNGRNPATGDTVKLPAKTLPRFTAGKGFKEAVNKPKAKAKTKK